MPPRGDACTKVVAFIGRRAVSYPGNDSYRKIWQEIVGMRREFFQMLCGKVVYNFGALSDSRGDGLSSPTYLCDGLGVANQKSI